MQAFTKAVTVPSCGYSSLQESWEASDGLRWIPDITTPTLMVSAKDDPFLDPQYDLQPCTRGPMAQSCSMQMSAATHLLMHPTAGDLCHPE